MASEKPNIPIIGPMYEPPEAASTSKVPTIGPVQENETKARVKAIKKIPIKPPRSEAESALLIHELGMCLPPEWVDLELVLPAAQVAAEESKGFASTYSNQGIWSIFLIAFLSGFVALFTPCVFPMIPMTVSFFTKQSENKAAGIRNAIIYGLSIIFIYVILGVAVSAIFGADALNNMATNVYFNIAFFLLLVIFTSNGGFILFVRR